MCVSEGVGHVEAGHSCSTDGSDYCNQKLKKMFFFLAEEEADPQIVLMKVTKLLRSGFGFSSITVQVER